MAFAGMFMVTIFIVLLIIYLWITYIVGSIAYMRLFTKAFDEPRWKAFIPFYNTFTFYSKIGVQWVYIINVIVAVIALFVSTTSSQGDLIILYYLAMRMVVEYHLVKKINQSMGFIALGLVLPRTTFLINGIRYKEPGKQ